jgi:hypothetical protein
MANDAYLVTRATIPYGAVFESFTDGPRGVSYGG